jgi:hypothetical protein
VVSFYWLLTIPVLFFPHTLIFPHALETVNTTVSSIDF